jgi:preprotein translocase subunit SecA
MMQRFQDETVRYLYLMQVVSGGPELERRIPEEASAEGAGARVPAALPSGDGGRRPRATSIDEIEQEFQRRKRRELEAARLAGSGDYQPVQQVVRTSAKVGRNDPCPCGSGKKYKKCHGAGA